MDQRQELQPARPQGQRVFIVHGHDDANMYRLRDLLRDRFHMEPIILRYEPGMGRTLIEKFEDEAIDCTYAFVIMSPDDQVRIDAEEYAQARPNVVFELGWLYGKLGRRNVCILFKKGTHIHSDLEGISQIPFNESVEEVVLEIERELRSAAFQASHTTKTHPVAAHAVPNLSEDARNLLLAAASATGNFAGRFAVHTRPDFVKTQGFHLEGVAAIRAVRELVDANLAKPEKGAFYQLTTDGWRLADSMRGGSASK